MSNLFALPSLELLLIAGRAAALVAAFAMFGWGFLRWRRAAQCDTQRVFEQLDLVRADLLIMKEAMNKTVHRVDTAAQRIAHDARLAPPPIAASSGRGYEIAARLARNGANKEEIIKSCGVTAHEAELLVKLHGRTQPRVQNTASDRAAQIAAANAGAVGKQVRRQQQTAAPSQPTPRASQPMRSRLVAVG